ncbi:hypothetical protein [Halococcus agarilyticus]|uniref:hypothetical protein n=1 Tax=Halococcus agarilyticus TaxID=1232219 RepID=UPI000677A91E|nr:hypothetical protein [Halococcus agarilyticus]
MSSNDSDPNPNADAAASAITSESPDIERDDEMLSELNDLLAGNLEATVGERGTEDFYEVYVLPDPDPESQMYLVMLCSTEGELFHAATFDVDDLETTAAHTKLLDR